MKATVTRVDLAAPAAALSPNGAKLLQPGKNDVKSIEYEDGLFVVVTKKGQFFVPVSAVQSFQIGPVKK